MNKFLGFLGIIFCLNSHADLIVYTLKTSATVTGNGSTQKVSSGGFIIFDTSNGSIAEVVTVPKLMKFSTEFPTTTFNYIDGGKRNYTVFTFTPSVGTGSSTVKGLTDSIYSGAQFWNLPKTLTITGSAVVSGVLSEGNGKLIFDSSNTATLTLGSYTLQSATDYFSSLLSQKGYTPL